jgi:lysozyme family protein
MASFDLFFEELLKKEGWGGNDPVDRGGLTRLGITHGTWSQLGWDKDGDGDVDPNDLLKITRQDAYKLYKKEFWDKISADQIKNQGVAEIYFDMFVNSGRNAIRIMQRLLNNEFGWSLLVDGVSGPKTLAAINGTNPKLLFDAYKKARVDFYNAIVRNDPTQSKFIRGWINRVNSFVWEVYKKKELS